MSEQPETLEDAANLLTGVMIFLLGAALLTLLVWMAVSGRIDRIDRLDFDSLIAASFVISGSIIGIGGMRWGLRTVRIHLANLRRRRTGSASG